MNELLKKLLPAAEAQGIKLGIENRQALEELPFESDFQFLFRELASPNLVYWHDTGHAQIKENLGFIQPRHAPGILARPPLRLSYPRRAIPRPRPLCARHRA